MATISATPVPCRTARVMIKTCLILIAVAISCHGQIADFFFPQVTKTTRDVVDELTKTPLVSFTTKTSGDLLAAAASTIAWAPGLVARAFGVGNGLPIIASDSNLIEKTDNYITDFTTGLSNEDAHMPITQIVNKYGYQFEQHEVVTEDGFVLTLFRIPGNGSVVFLMHGLLGSADDYIIAGPEDGLAYLLAKEGYDVWMGNARGNKHSRRHVKLAPSEASFWDFSWHEIGYYDLPAMIDYALRETTETKLKYIGHSQGTTTFFVMCSQRPEYNDKISLMIALSPVVYMSNAKSPIVRILAPGTPIIHAVAKSIGIYEFLPDDTIMRIMKLLMCGTGPLSEILCSNIIFLMAGFGYPQMNFTNLAVVLGHMPSGASAKQFAHYGQGVISGEFQQFDYGTSGNLEKYGTEIPPAYPLEKVSAPVSLFYSDADWLAHPDDVDLLYNRLPNAVDIHKIPSAQFNHLDFIIAKDFKALIYKRIRKLMKHFS